MGDETRTAAPACDRSAVLAELVDLLTARAQAGQLLDPNALAAEFPEWAADLLRLLPAVAAMADLSRAGAAAGRAPTGLGGAGEETPGTLGDYRIVREVGRGGMGVVYEAEQLSLRRRVALKVLPFAAVMDPRHLQRFRNEALAAASLDHPHAVKVYGVGCERGVHYIAMQFVDGRTLADLIRERRGEAVRPAPGADATRTYAADTASTVSAEVRAPSSSRAKGDAAYFRRVAGWGAQAAEALEHAHGLGVVHRDVKPGNLLVDGRGELHVADFGLAKLAADPGVTVTGDLLGTLRYMSPEQAAAKHDLVDHRSDVYSLGVTLYELLTLEPAFAGQGREEILSRIASAEPVAPRKLERSVPRDLETVVLKAMEKDPARRYQSAQELADDLRRFLGAEPIRARRPGLTDRTAKWVRRHRAAVGAVLGAALVVLPTLVGIVGWGLTKEANRRAWNDKWADTMLSDVEEAYGKGDLIAARQLLLKREEHLLDEVRRSRADRWRADLDMVDRLAEIRIRGSDLQDDTFVGSTVDRDYAAAFQEYGIDVEHTSPARVVELIAASRIRAELAAALDEWAEMRRAIRKTDGDEWWKRLVEIARAADNHETRVRIRDALLRRDLAALQTFASAPDRGNFTPAAYRALAKGLTELGDLSGAVVVLRRAQRKHPDDFWVNYTLASTLSQEDPSRGSEVLSFYTAAVAVNPRSPAARLALGHVLNQLGETAEAEACYREALRVKPGYAPAYAALGIVLFRRGNRADAELFIRFAIGHKPNFAAAHFVLGIFLLQQDRSAEAEASFRRAIECNPGGALAYFYLGDALGRLGRFEESLAAYRRGHELGSKQKGWPDPSGARVRWAERMAYLAQKVPKVAAGEEKPAGLDEMHELAEMGLRLRWYVTSARLYADLLALDPKLALKRNGALYNGACAALLAGVGRGESAGKLAAEDRPKWRAQALRWLTEELTAWSRLAERPAEVANARSALLHWRLDSDLAPVRDEAELKKLPEAEQAEWRKLWAAVAELEARVALPLAPAPRPKARP
jgi:serine/threonine protein kinase/tetratricopeptide (TPR) repeat protein